MSTVWFAILSLMLTTYVVLDGFDFGVGVAHLFVAKTDEERRTTLAAIGPVWDGNEVWLIGSGGLLFFAFPHVYASATSGFYMPLMIVLWLLILRGLSIELRSRVENPLWRAFWDAGFAGASFLLAFVFGVTFGNVVRGVPVDDDGFFSTPLFTHLLPSTDAGAIDLYTAAIGLFAALALALHGCLYLRWKTEGPVAERATWLARKLFFVVLAFDLVVAVASARVNTSATHAFLERPLAWLFAAVALGGAGLLGKSLRGDSARDELMAFVGSCIFLAATLIAGACALFPTLLRSTLSDAYSLDAIRSSSGAHGLAFGLVWFLPAIALAIAYLIYVLRETRGKARPESH